MVEVSAEITFKVPDTVRNAELRDFIKEALGTWGGQRHPDDHLFHSLERVRVPRIVRAPK